MTLKQKIKDIFFNKATHTTIEYPNGNMPKEVMNLLAQPLED